MGQIKREKNVFMITDISFNDILKELRIDSGYRALDVINGYINDNGRVKEKFFPVSRDSLCDISALKEWTEWLTSHNIPWIITKRRTKKRLIPNQLVLWTVDSASRMLR